MGVKPTRDTSGKDRNPVATPADQATGVSESGSIDDRALLNREAPRVDIHDLPRNEALRHPVAEPSVDARAGETASQDVAPSSHDLELEAQLLQRRQGAPGIDAFREAQSRFEPGLDVASPGTSEEPDEER